MTQRGNLEDYLKGRPQTDELARLAAGEEDDAEPSNVVEMAGPQLVSGPIDDDDREHLRRLLLEPGWPILLKLLDRRISFEEDAARSATKLHPFAKDENAARWAMVAALEEARRNMVALAESEVAQLEQGAKK